LKTVVVLPAFNEAGNITPLVTGLLAVAAQAALDLAIVIVDDGSTDSTADESRALSRRHPEVRLVSHQANLGFAAALKTGIAAARHQGCDAAVLMDCDLSHRPSDLPMLVDAVAGGADLALGSRFVPGGGMRGVPLWRVAISRGANTLGRRLLRLPTRDLTTGYRALGRRALDRLRFGENSFAIQLEVAASAAVSGLRIVEVPIVLEVRRHGTSHMRYTPRLFLNYWRVLRRCRQELRDCRA
jgi:dolichol-phosphate mannosyltransferase